MTRRLKINWFSPLPPTRSEIARQTLTLLPELSRRADVVVWCSDREAGQYARVAHYTGARPPWREINSADVTFYQMGNDPRYHEDIWRISRVHPGIVLLHDLKLQHFFAGLVASEAMTKHDYLDLIEIHHGAAERTQAEEFLAGRIGIDQLVETAPLSTAALEGALAGVVHSRPAYDALLESTSVPLAYLPLYAATSGPDNDDFLRERERSDGPYRIILFGYLGPNRRLPAILQALASFPERDRFRLDVYGPMEGAEKIDALVDQLGFAELVQLHGFASESELARALQRSHLALNLRFPSMGEASASQLHLWQYALPALVSRTAWYASLPDDTVAFVRPDHEIEDIHLHLGRFLEEPERYRAMGLNGRRYVQEHCTATSYTDGIMEMADRTPELHTIWIARQMAERAGSAIGGLSEDDATRSSDRVAEQIEALVGGCSRPATAAA